MVTKLFLRRKWPVFLRILPIVILLIIKSGHPAAAQKKLTTSRQSSYYTYIFKLNADEVEWLHKHPGEAPPDQIFHTIVDSFKTDRYWENKLPFGNYLKIHAEKNRLKYALVENHNIFVRFFSDHNDQRFIFIDKDGKEIKPLTVTENGSRIDYDKFSGTYHIKRPNKQNILKAEFDGFTNFFLVKKKDYNEDDDDKSFFARISLPIKRLFKTNDHYHYQPTKNKYTGLIIFNKPVYKPYDTVKFKAFILEIKSKKPVAQQHLVAYLTGGYNNEKKKLGVINAYRPGGFEYRLILNDSLKLDLDRTYTIMLQDPKVADDKKTSKNNERNQYLLTGNFHYEDYELKSTRFSMRPDKKEQVTGQSLSVYLKATDENDLPVIDGRITLKLITGSISSYKSATAYIPDTLWTHSFTLDPINETKIIIPDSIFPKADFNYRIEADFLNSSNEHRTQTEYISFRDDRFNILTELSGDTLLARYEEFSRPQKSVAYVSALSSDDDTLSKVKVTLPAKTILNPFATTYTVETDSTDTEIELKKFDSGISLSAEQTADSLFVKVTNQRNLHFWYSVYAGNEQIDAGEAEQIFYHKAYNGSKLITFLVNYIWAGESRSEKTALVYRKDLLKMNVKQPVSVYPGQTVQTDIVVTDAVGKPVANTDITAWAITRKFSYYPPNPPFLGRSFGKRKFKQPFETDDVDAIGNMKLDWNKWSHSLGLDTLAYYQFTHTTGIYRSEENSPDTVTQIAPFIVKNGDIVPIHILYIDERPVYFSQSQQLNPYSFRISPGKHSIRFRTSHQLIKLDSVYAEKSKKLILGINPDYLVSTKVSDTLSNYEAGLLNKYFITMVDNFDQHMALIRQNEQVYFLNATPSANRRILTGPLSDNYTTFDLEGTAPRNFLAEPGYAYQFLPGLLKQKSIDAAYPFNLVVSSAKGTDDYTQYAMTQSRADSIWQDYQDHRANQNHLFINPEIAGTEKGVLSYKRQNSSGEKLALIKHIMLYRYDNPDFIRIYHGNATDFGQLEKGDYRLFFLLKGDTYFIKEHIFVKPYGTNFYRFRVDPEHSRDSVSIQIDKVIKSRLTPYNPKDYEIENDALKLKEAFNDKYLDKTTFTTEIRGTVTASDDKMPIVGATVKIKGTNLGAVTNSHGEFSIKAPLRGILIISNLGYQAKEVHFSSGDHIQIALDPSKMALNEVVVIGYGSVKRKDLTGAVVSYSVENLLQGKVAGVMIARTDSTPGSGFKILLRGNRSLIPGNDPLYIIDGVLSKDMKGLILSDISSIDVLKDAAAVALYGSEAANGVIIVTTKKQNAHTVITNNTQKDTNQTLRKNFRDYAYWQPKLTTDENGKASFTSTFPDDITNWRTFVIGINGQRQSGFAEGSIKSFKPVSANFVSPLFAVEGDQMKMIGKVLNYNTGPVKLTRTFSYNNKTIRQDDLTIVNSKIDTLAITVDSKDSLTFEYTIKRDNGYFDGERRKIPVVLQGTQETKGFFEALTHDTTVTFRFDPTLGPVTFRAEASLLPALLRETERLRNYRYLCNEQLASKLKGLLAEKRIRAYLNEPFKWDRNVKELINKLQQNRLSNGTWGWWKDSADELWISLHAVEALLDADQMGYTTQLDKEKLTAYLVYQMESYRGEAKLSCLQLLKLLNAKVDYQRFTGLIAKELTTIKDTSKYNKFRLLLLRQQAGLPVKADSLLKMAKHTLFGNLYWGEGNYRFFDNATQLSVLAYHILKNDGGHPEALAKIRGYLLEQRSDDHWQNTYETSLILETILPDLLKEDKTLAPPALRLSGAINDNIDKFPYTGSFSNNELSIVKTGPLAVYITGFQQFHNSNPEKASKHFVVNTHFEQQGMLKTKLKGGAPVTLKVEVTAKADGDFVMIEIPIPAGCSYESKEQPYNGIEVHREYFKDKVSIFCRKLKHGNYTFNVNLMPRYGGVYTLNPAKAELMYFPVFYGREGMKKVVIGE